VATSCRYNNRLHAALTTMPGRLAGIIVFGVDSSSARVDKSARSFCKSLIQISWNPGPTRRLRGSGGFAFQP